PKPVTRDELDRCLQRWFDPLAAASDARASDEAIIPSAPIVVVPPAAFTTSAVGDPMPPPPQRAPEPRFTPASIPAAVSAPASSSGIGMTPVAPVAPASIAPAAPPTVVPTA